MTDAGISGRDYNVTVVGETVTVVPTKTTTQVHIEEPQPLVSINNVGIPGPIGGIGPVGPIGPTGPRGLEGGSAQRFTYEQPTPSDEWVIEHGLGRLPNVSVIDSANEEVVGHVIYIDNNTVILRFSGAFAGTAILGG